VKLAKSVDNSPSEANFYSAAHEITCLL